MSTDVWQVADLDLEGYLARTGAPSRPPAADALAELHEAHVRAFTFDNVDVLLRRHPGVSLAAVQEKFVGRGRDGEPASRLGPDEEEPMIERTRTPEQAAAWAKVEEERRLAGPPVRVGPSPRAVAHLVVGVLVIVAALTTWWVTSETYDDRLDVLVLIGLLGGGAALAATVLPGE